MRPPPTMSEAVACVVRLRAEKTCSGRAAGCSSPLLAPFCSTTTTTKTMNSNSTGSSSNTQPPLPPLPPPRTNSTGSALAVQEEATGQDTPGMVYPPLGYEHLRPTSPTPTGSAVQRATGNHDPRTSLLLGPVPPMVTVPPMVSGAPMVAAVPSSTSTFAGSFAAAPAAAPYPVPAPAPVPVPVSAPFMGAVTTAPIARMSSIGPGVGITPYPPVSVVGVAPYPPASGVAPYPPASGVTPYPPVSAEYGAPLAVAAAAPVMAQVPPASYLSGVAPSIPPGAMDGSAPVPVPVPVAAPVSAVPLRRQPIGTDPNGNYFLVERTDPDGVTASHGTIIVPFGRPSEAALATPIDPTPPPVPVPPVPAPAPAASDPDPSPPRPVRPGASLWTETRPQVRPRAWSTVPFWLKSLTAIMSIVGLVLAVNTLPDSAAALRVAHPPTTTTTGTPSDSADAPFIAAYLWLMVLSLAYCLTYLILFSGCFYSPFSQKVNVSAQRQGWKLKARRWMLMPVEAGLMSVWAIIALIMGFLHAPFAMYVTSCPESAVAVAGMDDTVVPATGVSCYDAKVLLGVASTVAILWGLNVAQLFYGIWKNQAKIEHLAQVQQEATGGSQ
ncbi:hypothetical protein AMAG_07665, partial [Allomyces macrogynus ATCC 38327]